MQHSRLKGAAFLCAIFLALFASAAHAQKSGAWFWGDGDGSGGMGGPDLTVLYQVIANPSVNDASIYGGYPQSRFRQDLDGNGSIGGPDANILYPWLAGNYSNHPGTPDRLLLDGTTNLNVNLGDSVTLQAYSLAPAAQGSVLRTGLGVNFQIIGGTCTTAEIYGYNVAGGATANAWRNPSAYHYLPTRLAPDNGRVWVKARGNTCGNGQTTIIKVYIPDDLSAGVLQSRFPTELDAQLSATNSTPVNYTITWISGTAPDTIITAHPSVLSNSREASFSFICDTPPCTFECNLDSSVWSACSPPATYGTSSIDSWSATSTTDVPDGRELHTAVWTGSEMVVWGGESYAPSYHYLNSGGRYDPATDSWTATSLTNAPEPPGIFHCGLDRFGNDCLGQMELCLLPSRRQIQSGHR